MNNKEIGGYFEIEEQTNLNVEYHLGLISLNAARNALIYIIKAKNIKKVYLPFYLCQSVYKACEREGCRYDFYHVDSSFMPIFNKTLKNNEYLYIVNYFGILTDDDLNGLKQNHKNIIVDYVQCFFRKPIKGIDTIYSCRKFFGVPDGSYLSTDCLLEYKLSTDKSNNRLSHLYGRKNDGATAHFKEFKNNDSSFLTLPLMEMSKITKNMMCHIDYNDVIKKRNNNYSYLYDELCSFNDFKISKNIIGPYCYPFYCSDGDVLRKILILNKIYVPVLWPNVVELNILESDYARNILPLPCDQRYDKNDMKIIVNIIKDYINR